MSLHSSELQIRRHVFASRLSFHSRQSQKDSDFRGHHIKSFASKFGQTVQISAQLQEPRLSLLSPEGMPPQSLLCLPFLLVTKIVVSVRRQVSSSQVFILPPLRELQRTAIGSTSASAQVEGQRPHQRTTVRQRGQHQQRCDFELIPLFCSLFSVRHLIWHSSDIRFDSFKSYLKLYTFEKRIKCWEYIIKHLTQHWFEMLFANGLWFDSQWVSRCQ